MGRYLVTVPVCLSTKIWKKGVARAAEFGVWAEKNALAPLSLLTHKEYRPLKTLARGRAMLVYRQHG